MYPLFIATKAGQLESMFVFYCVVRYYLFYCIIIVFYSIVVNVMGIKFS